MITLLSDTWDSVDSGSVLFTGTGKRENESRRENSATKWTGETGTPVGSGRSISTSLTAISNADLSSQNSQVQSLLRKFEDIFNVELPPGPPPQRSVEFKVDLIPDAKPTNKSPYKLSPVEREEIR